MKFPQWANISPASFFLQYLNKFLFHILIFTFTAIFTITFIIFTIIQDVFPIVILCLTLLIYLHNYHINCYLVRCKYKGLTGQVDDVAMATNLMSLWVPVNFILLLEMS